MENRQTRMVKKIDEVKRNMTEDSIKVNNNIDELEKFTMENLLTLQQDVKSQKMLISNMKSEILER